MALLGGAAAWPVGARAQQPAMPVIGFMSARSPGDSAHLVDAFRQSLKDGGVVEGQNVTVEYRWAHGDYGRLPALARNSSTAGWQYCSESAAMPPLWRQRRPPRPFLSSSACTQSITSG
jgi:hypothetical protein